MIFLHIGRTKTGTTALQAFLGSNADVLSKAELHFPIAGSRGNAHHDVALALTPKRMQRATEEARRIALNELAAMKQHVRSGRNLIVSSEMFQQADPKLVAAIFPPGDTRIIVYLREQYDYLVSAYAQRIQVSLARTPFVRYASRFNPDYLPFLESWATFFGRENIDVGIYDRSLLLNGDIRQDFLARLNISAADFKNMLSMPKNPTIGAQLIEFKGILNSLVPAQIHSRFDIGGQLSRVAGKSEKFSASAAFAVEYRARFKSNDIVEKHYLASRTIPRKSVSGTGVLVDRDSAVEFGMEALLELSPALRTRVGDYVTANAIGNVDPILPQNWDSALESYKRAVGRTRRRKVEQAPRISRCGD